MTEPVHTAVWRKRPAGAPVVVIALPDFAVAGDGIAHVHAVGVVRVKRGFRAGIHHHKVKVLDFGLAKALAPESQPVDASHSPTLTRTGAAILGTAAYMSPEQARGKPVDKRTDVASASW